jgi:DNA-binding phage protein
MKKINKYKTVDVNVSFEMDDEYYKYLEKFLKENDDANLSKLIQLLIEQWVERSKYGKC